MQREEKKIVDDFNRLYYDGLESEGNIYLRTFWMGVQCCKCPTDMWVYQEIIAELKPELIVETGTFMGGSALFLAHMLDIVGGGEIITIDVEKRSPMPKHPRIRYVTGSSADSELVHSLLAGRPEQKRLIILDSDHTKTHVLNELKLFSPYVNVGSYLIVEDTNINGHPAFPTYGEGPYEAVEEFLESNQDFAIDPSKEKFLATFNPNGFLKRLSRSV